MRISNSFALPVTAWTKDVQTSIQTHLASLDTVHSQTLLCSMRLPPMLIFYCSTGCVFQTKGMCCLFVAHAFASSHCPYSSALRNPSWLVDVSPDGESSYHAENALHELYRRSFQGCSYVKPIGNQICIPPSVEPGRTALAVFLVTQQAVSYKTDLAPEFRTLCFVDGQLSMPFSQLGRARSCLLLTSSL